MGNGGCPAHQDKILAELKEVKKHLSGKIECIEKKLLDPDKGLYARTRMNTEFRKEAEPLMPEVVDNTKFRKSTRKGLWVIVVTLTGLVVRILYDAYKRVFLNG